MQRNKETENTMEYNELIAVFVSIKDEKTMGKFIKEIFTKSEIADFSLRWQLMKMLKAGMPQRKIASELGISLCKITRGAKVLKDRNAITNRYIKPSEIRRSNA
jgi:TrpR family trp operon transcriptional repressor